MIGTKLAQFVTIVALVSLLGNSGLLFGDDTLSGGPYAQNPNNATATSSPDPTTMNIIWYTGQPVPSLNCYIQYRVAGQNPPLPITRPLVPRSLEQHIGHALEHIPLQL